MQQLWPKLIQIFPGQINGTFMMLGKQIYLDKTKNYLKSKYNKNISYDKAIIFCVKYNVGLPKQHLKQKLMKELFIMITERVK